MSNSQQHFDVIVIGGGHAGCEAALAAVRLGARTMMMTLNPDHIGQMSCNPSIGGIAKGQTVREIDALGGEMGRNTDATAIQVRMLNQSKGPAVWSPRAQCDKLLYQRRMKHVLERETGLFIHQAEAVAICHDGEKVTGIRSQFNETFTAAAVIICTGTFLKGLLHYGDLSFPGGRAGDPAAFAMSDSLVNDMGLEIGRLKTGTPPRVMGHTVDFSQMIEQPCSGDARFSHWPEDSGAFRTIVPDDLPRRSCYLVRTTPETRDIVSENLHRSPMVNGKITGIGTRYCPSFEDKVVRFPHHECHQLYLEPEGVFTEEFYLNGISTSLPVDVQRKMIRSVPGLERAELSRYAYAVEYDVVLPHQLTHSLAVRPWPNLFLAGQINGTTGYEEAAGQGIIAGINAARLAGGKGEALVLKRDEAYIGVLIDDLCSKDIVEPYRLFTSRAEYRLLLRQDNACRRLSKIGNEIGLLDDSRYRQVVELEAHIEAGRKILHENRQNGESLWDLLRKKKLDLSGVDGIRGLPAEVRRQLEIEALYDGYIRREMKQAADLKRLEQWSIPAEFSYDMPGLRAEARMKLKKMLPETLAQAARIDGVTPSEIALLQVHLKRRAG